MQSNRRPRKAEELENIFNKQMELLFRACRSFDAGSEVEAANIAIRLRVLLHNNPKRNSHAVLAQLHLLDEMQFVDSGVRRDLLDQAITAHIIGENSFIAGGSPSDTGLVIPGVVNGRGKFIAPLKRNRFHADDFRSQSIVQSRDFDDWWTTAFIETLNGRLFSRKDIVMTMANQDGGGHVDPNIDVDFDDLCQDSHGLEYWDGNHEDGRFESNIVHASIRQIAFEVMATIDDEKGTNWVERTGNLRERAGWYPDIAYMVAYRQPELEQ